MATSVGLKKVNTQKIRAVLKTMETHTKNSLAAATNLSVATCGNILKDMLISGEVNEIEQAESTGGRPSRQFIYNKNYGYILTLYARQEKDSKSVFFAVSNLVGEVVYDDFNEYEDITLDVIDTIVENLISEYPKIKVLAIGVPGVVNDGYVGICDFDAFKNFDLKKHYENKYDFEITVINDVNCISLGYYSRNAFKKDESMVYIYYPLDDGPGAGIVIDGKVHKGASNFAGEVGYLPHYIFKNQSSKDVLNISPFAQDVLQTIISVNCIINPKTIVLSGFQFNDELIFNLSKLTRDYLPIASAPEILFEEDMHDSYVNGLIAIGLEQLKYNFEI